jgi:hypothetical protein
MNAMQMIRAWLGDGNAQLGLALDTWFGSRDQRNVSRALYWARRAERNGTPDASMLIVSILHESPSSD